jgi:hypothetical protein
MQKLVIMPGGFHPFHAGHADLYDQAREAFPDADVYVAATDDVSTRPFPFAVKEKLAKLAGVEPGHFVRVKSPFRAEEITRNYDPNNTVLIFVRSEKDAQNPPRAGGVKKDGSPAYLQPLGSDLKPMSQHGYMTYLKTVPFADGMTSASDIRREWPTLSTEEKTNRVMSLYPKIKNNARLASNVVKLLDAAIQSGNATNEAVLITDPEQGHLIVPDGGMGTWSEDSLRQALAKKFRDLADMMRLRQYNSIYHNLYDAGTVQSMLRALQQYDRFLEKQGRKPIGRGRRIDLSAVPENQGWAATYNETQTAGTPASALQASYQRRENQPMAEDYAEESGRKNFLQPDRS